MHAACGTRRRVLPRHARPRRRDMPRWIDQVIEEREAPVMAIPDEEPPSDD